MQLNKHVKRKKKRLYSDLWIVISDCNKRRSSSKRLSDIRPDTNMKIRDRYKKAKHFINHFGTSAIALNATLPL